MNRSYLFIPGNNPGMIQNADVFGSDAIIFDIEDSVHVQEKDNARNLVKSFLEKTNDYTSKIVIRINDYFSPFFESDLQEIVSDHIDAIMLPKARISSVQKLDEILTAIEFTKQMKKKITIIPIIEQAISLLEVNTIASLPRMSGLLLGAEDLCSDLEIKRTKTGEEILYARSCVVMAAKAFGLDAIDTPFTDVYDDEGMTKDSLKAASLGMNAKSCIHPRQVDVINEVFSPSEEQVLWAKKVLEANRIAMKKGLGVFSLDGKMIDKPIIDRALKTIEKAKRFGLLGQDYDN